MNHITNNKVVSWTSSTSIEATILQHRVCRAGHVSRIRPTWLPWIILFEEFASGKKLYGGPKRRYIDPDTWGTIAANRLYRYRTIRVGTETWVKHEEDLWHEVRTSRLAQLHPSPTLCDSCTWLFRRRLAFHSHLPTTATRREKGNKERGCCDASGWVLMTIIKHYKAHR